MSERSPLRLSGWEGSRSASRPHFWAGARRPACRAGVSQERTPSAHSLHTEIPCFPHNTGRAVPRPRPGRLSTRGPGSRKRCEGPHGGDGGPAQPRGGIYGARTYPPALVKWAHVGEPGSGAEPGGHDHGGAIGGEHLEAISVDTVNREERLTTQPTGYSPQSRSESDKQTCTALPCRDKGSRGFRARSVVSNSQG